MTAKLTLFVVCCTAFPFSAFAQLNASVLRRKYGEPLPRETFRVRPHFEAVFSYGPARQVCRIELPPDNSKIAVGEALSYLITKQQVDEVIDELVPPAIRGKLIQRSIAGAGSNAIDFTEYKHVYFTEPRDPDHPGLRTGVTITFNRSDCH